MPEEVQVSVSGGDSEPAPVVVDDAGGDVAEAQTDAILSDRISGLEDRVNGLQDQLGSVVTTDMLENLQVPEHDHDTRYYRKEEVDGLVPEPGPELIEVTAPELPPDMAAQEQEVIEEIRGPRKVGWTW